MGRAIGRALRQLFEFGRDAHELCVERQLTPQKVQFVEVEVQRATALHDQRLAQHLRGHEGIAVAVAPDPGSGADERGEFSNVPVGIDGTNLVFKVSIEPGELAQECIIVIGKPIVDFVDDGKPGPAHDVCLPKRKHGTA